MLSKQVELNFQVTALTRQRENKDLLCLFGFTSFLPITLRLILILNGHKSTENYLNVKYNNVIFLHTYYFLSAEKYLKGKIPTAKAPNEYGSFALNVLVFGAHC